MTRLEDVDVVGPGQEDVGVGHQDDVILLHLVLGVEQEPTEPLPQWLVTQAISLTIRLLVKPDLNIILDHRVHDVVVLGEEGGVVVDLHHHLPHPGQLRPEEGGEEGGGEQGGVWPVEDGHRHQHFLTNSMVGLHSTLHSLLQSRHLFIEFLVDWLLQQGWLLSAPLEDGSGRRPLGGEEL